MKLLISGTRRGLGRYLYERFGGDSVTREHPVQKLGLPDRPYDAIVHCAFNPRRDIFQPDVYGYIEDSVYLTDALTRLSYRKFILISSVDVYPSRDVVYDEDTPIAVFEGRDPYAFCKLATESIVRRNCEDWLILRPGMLLGRYMRPNNLTRLVRGDPGRLTLTGDSGYYCVLHSDIGDIVEAALEQNLTGVLNVARSSLVTMSEMAARFGRQLAFGSYFYRPAKITNERLVRACPAFAASSMSAVESFVSGAC